MYLSGKKALPEAETLVQELQQECMPPELSVFKDAGVGLSTVHRVIREKSPFISVDTFVRMAKAVGKELVFVNINETEKKPTSRKRRKKPTSRKRRKRASY